MLKDKLSPFYSLSVEISSTSLCLVRIKDPIHVWCLEWAVDSLYPMQLFSSLTMIFMLKLRKAKLATASSNPSIAISVLPCYVSLEKSEAGLKI